MQGLHPGQAAALRVLGAGSWQSSCTQAGGLRGQEESPGSASTVGSGKEGSAKGMIEGHVCSGAYGPNRHQPSTRALGPCPGLQGDGGSFKSLPSCAAEIIALNCFNLHYFLTSKFARIFIFWASVFFFLNWNKAIKAFVLSGAPRFPMEFWSLFICSFEHGASVPPSLVVCLLIV